MVTAVKKKIITIPELEWMIFKCNDQIPRKGEDGKYLRDDIDKIEQDIELEFEKYQNYWVGRKVKILRETSDLWSRPNFAEHFKNFPHFHYEAGDVKEITGIFTDPGVGSPKQFKQILKMAGLPETGRYHQVILEINGFKYEGFNTFEHFLLGPPFLYEFV